MDLYKYLEDRIDTTKIEEFKSDEYELAIIRYVLMETSKIFYRDREFFLNREDIKRRRLIYSQKIDVRNITCFEIVCSSYCNLLKDVLENKYNIKVKLITTDCDMFQHVVLLLITKSGNRYLIDPLMDLTAMKVKMKTSNFASKENRDNPYIKIKIDNLEFLDEKVLKKIDEKIGYLTNNSYADNYIYNLKEQLHKFENSSDLQKKAKIADELLGRSVNVCEYRDYTIFKIMCFFEIIRKHVNIKGIVDSMIFVKTVLNILFDEEEKGKIKVLDFFVDEYDLKDNEIIQILNSDEIRKRGLIIECSGKCIIFSICNEKYIIFSEKEWKEKVTKNNIFVRKSKDVTLYNYLHKLDIESNLLNHREFLRLLQKIEINIINEGKNPKDFIKIVNKKRISISYNVLLEFSIEEDVLVMYDKTNNKKIAIEFEDEGRNINYNVIN